MRWCSKHQCPITPRGAGTSLAGQTTGSGVIIDCGRHLRSWQRISPSRARVEPGVIRDDLNHAWVGGGRHFAPDTSTSNRCMIGGMIGNNSCGSHSVYYGTTRDHVASMDIILSSGEEARCEAMSPQEFYQQAAQTHHYGRILHGLDQIISRHRDLIINHSADPRIHRRNSGYALDALAQMQPWNPDGPPFNLCALLCGSEGTLALTSHAELHMVPRPRHRLLCAIHCRSITEACRIAPLAVQHECFAAELIDHTILQAAEQNRSLQQAVQASGWLMRQQGDMPPAILAVEFIDDDNQRLMDRMQHFITDSQQSELGLSWPILEGDQAQQVWQLRKSWSRSLDGTTGQTASRRLY